MRKNPINALRTGRVRTGTLRCHKMRETVFRCWMDSPQKPDQFVSIYIDGRSIY